MIITDFDIARRKEKRIEDMHAKIGRGKIPVEIQAIGQPMQYFYVFETEDGMDGICGIDAIILGLRNSSDPITDLFYADLGIVSHLPGFYVEYLDVPVLSISLVDNVGKKTIALCRYEDVDMVMRSMNDKFAATNKPGLKLVISNSTKNEKPDVSS